MRKHGIGFELAGRVLADPFVLTDQDRIEDGKRRWQSIGMVNEHVLLLVAHASWEEGDEQNVEVIRIISARRANRAERRRYESGDR